MTPPREIDLYPPIKSFFEAQSFEVKSEVNGCDVVAVREDEPPIIVELKIRFNLDLVLQAIDRTAMSDRIYIAFPDKPRTLWRKRRRSILKMCRMLGFGLLLVRPSRDGSARVTVELEPGPYAPRKSQNRTRRLLKEFSNRVGDPNTGGMHSHPVITAYRQDALRLVAVLARSGPASTKALREATGIERSTAILQRDVYGWFERVQRGVYRLSRGGEAALVEFSAAIESIEATGHD